MIKTFKRKPRLLFISEASFLKTGFSKITYEILYRLHKNGNIELAEIGSYAKSTDPRAQSLPWLFYGGIPEDNDQFSAAKEAASHHHKVYGQFGSLVFEQVCLDFKPDIVFDIRDYWMSTAWQLQSPYRKYFKYMICPTIDGEPQRFQWLDEYKQADKVIVYSDYGLRTLNRECPEINVEAVLRPGVDHEKFKPMDKKQLRTSMGLDPDAKIILTVMRNQKRKLFGDLIEAFDLYLKKCISSGQSELAKNSYLYLHTSYPDVGYDIQNFIMNNGLGSKVICTYLCRNCGIWYPRFFAGELTACFRCKSMASMMPNTNMGISDEDLCKVYNIADCYVQYSICEGLGMPGLEAKACGLPAFGVNYSATYDQVNEPGGISIDVERFFWESVVETEQFRALPSNEDFAKKMYSFFTNKTQEQRDAMGREGREYVVQNYSFDRAAKIIEDLCLSWDLPDQSKTWNNPLPNMCPNNTGNVNTGLPPSDFIKDCTLKILNRPDLIETYWYDDLIRSLSIGQKLLDGSRQYIRFNLEDCVNFFAQKAHEHNQMESIRLSKLMPKDDKQIKFEKI